MILDLGIFSRSISGKVFMLVNFRAFVKIWFVSFFRNGRKLSGLTCFIKVKKLIKKRIILKVVIINDTLVMVFMPFMTLYVDRAIRRILITSCGVRYNNWEVMKLLTL